MSDPKDFLSRWSRRKLEADEAKDAALAAKSAPAANEPRNDNAAVADAAPVAEFDLTKLPSLESIGANSDITVFLQRGVPAGLTRAALRRAWSADPAIRDFVGLSENSWDFNAPDSIPGFGSLDASEAKRIAAHFFGETAEGATGQASANDHSQLQAAQDSMESEGGHAEETQTAALEETKSEGDGSSEQTHSAVEKDRNAAPMPPATSPKTNAATQHEDDDAEHDSLPVQRRHGGALPA